MKKNGDKQYAQILDESGLFENTRENAISQTEIAKKIKNHVESGSNKKALYIAYDGARADLLFHISSCSGMKKNANAEESLCSGINRIKKEGGLYLCYTGGDVAQKETLQEASTISGFTTLATGVWADQHKVVTNNDGFLRAKDTIFLDLAKQGKKVSISARWDAFFTCIFKNEIDMDLKNYIAAQSKSDKNTFDNLSEGIRRGDDLVFGIFENPDYNGHSHTFCNKNTAYIKAFVDSDMYAYALVEQALARENEDWLVIITTDHGGHQYRHGTRKFTDTTTFLACNKKLDWQQH